MYWAILGRERAELSKSYPEIVEFAGIGDFVDTPLKYYSSGMRVRLAFAVATAVRPDILLLDEILAVGDGDFRDRSFERLKSFQADGCTIVFAAHALEVAAKFATNAVWIDQGHVRRQGPAREVVAGYEATFGSPGVTDD